ncbi:unnamed protein product [Paramecium primaurelia]|uniref:Peptidase S54 rhomboid domain-containing protein n=1 Tax=Paramecium primaurelia TaxID=5886 RepID=A0A8S1KCH3_PARPR|nr:unnamed protein product [Paramecium primaurelia]
MMILKQIQQKNELLNLVKSQIRVIIINASLFSLSLIERQEPKIIREIVLLIEQLSSILFIISSLQHSRKPKYLLQDHIIKSYSILDNYVPQIQNLNFQILLLSLKQHKNETHLFFSLLFKMYFLSFIEHNVGLKNTILIYFMSGISSTLFQAIVSQQSLWFLSYRENRFMSYICNNKCYVNIQYYKKEKCFAQQLQFYIDLQVSHDYSLILIKVAIVLSVLYITSLKFYAILMQESLLFEFQCMIFGQYFSYGQKKQHQLQLTNSTKQTQLVKYIYLYASVIIISIELIVFFLLKNLIKI